MSDSHDQVLTASFADASAGWLCRWQVPVVEAVADEPLRGGNVEGQQVGGDHLGGEITHYSPAGVVPEPPGNGRFLAGRRRCEEAPLGGAAARLIEHLRKGCGGRGPGLLAVAEPLLVGGVEPQVSVVAM